MGSSFTFSLAILLSLALFCVGDVLHGDVSYDNRAITINGRRKLIISGSIHYPRSTPGMWPSLIKNAKLGGLNAVETYVFWNAHEPQYRQYDFTGNKDLVTFIKTIHAEGLYAILRIGPYVCAEWNYGGLPVWLHNMAPGIEMRTNNTIYMNEMKTFMTLIVSMMRDNNLFASQGGPIILAQIENEYEIVQGSYGNNGYNYLQWCAKTATEFNLGIPWIMCKQNNAPEPMISACNSWYCDQYYPQNKNVPKIWTENWTGWFTRWGGKIPLRTAEDLAFSVARFFQLRGTVQNYYMYHGGTNFGNTAAIYMTTSYDYDAPIDEYGNLNQPKWGHLKNLHEVLFSMEDILTYGDDETKDYGDGKFVTIFYYREKRICFFANIKTEDKTLIFEGKDYVLLGWSVSILPDCYTEVYNTAKVNAQTSVMEYRPNSDEKLIPYKLEWQWTAEHVLHINRFGSVDKSTSLTANSLLEQKKVTNDTSDYLWLMTNYIHNSSEFGKNRQTFLHLHTKGQVVHAFVNGKHIGSQWGEYNGNDDYEFDFERKILLHPGWNKIALVSATVGLPNHSARFDTHEYGIVGPIKLIAKSTTGNEPDMIKDISSNTWVYKTGLHGEDAEYYKIKPRKFHKWSIANRPINRPFTWYLTNFKTPRGVDPVVVDLNGMGKGIAWVNDIKIGRYWPGYVASDNDCGLVCDYKDQYSPGKCASGCGQPTQRYYHIPRDWLRPDNNQLALFEELGGNPDQVQINTVTINKVCAHAYEGQSLKIACQGGQRIREITFASFGDPTGKCGYFTEGDCHSENAKAIVEKACLHQKKCFIDVSLYTFGALPIRCRELPAFKLAVEVVC